LLGWSVCGLVDAKAKNRRLKI